MKEEKSFMRQKNFNSGADNRFYEEALDRYVWQTYLADVDKGDRTTEWFLPSSLCPIRAEIIAKEKGVLAGMAEAEWFLKKLGLRIFNKKPDGHPMKENEKILILEGRADCILTSERTLLNLLQRMSGVATATRKLAAKLPRGIRLLATRKTLWGALDKRAVVVGGGLPHRFNLADAILVKDNHLALAPDWPLAWKRILKRAKGMKFIEIELQSLKEVGTFVAIQKNAPLDNVIVMLDNFTPAHVRAALKLLKPSRVKIEVSGGITEKNIRNYAIPGVHFISSGGITMRAPSLDLSLQILP